MSNGYIAYDPYKAGVNNVRLNFEIVAALAHLTDRVVVLPSSKMSMEREQHAADGTYVPYHPAAFLDISGVPCTPEEALPPGLTVHEVPPIPNRDGSVLVLKPGPKIAAFCGSRENVWLGGEAAEADVIRLPEIIMPFYAAIFTDAASRRRAARFVCENVRHLVEVREAALVCAERVRSFHAAVVRRNEFIHAYPQANIPAERIANTLSPIVPRGSKLLIATDEADRSFFAPLARRWEVVYARDVVREAAPGMTAPLIGCVEQFMCARGLTFTGTFLSTFSAYVDRLRGYMGLGETPRFTDGRHERVNDDNGSLFSWEATLSETNALWGREFREGWEWAK